MGTVGGLFVVTVCKLADDMQGLLGFAAFGAKGSTKLKTGYRKIRLAIGGSPIAVRTPFSVWVALGGGRLRT